MWTLNGPFDGDDPLGPTNFIRTKLLKPGTSYGIGRRDQPIIINNKRISTEHIVLNVGPYPTDKVSDPTEKPTLRVHNSRDKPLMIQGNGDIETLNAQSDLELQHEHEIKLANNIFVQALWLPVCCYLARPTLDMINSCAALGVSVVQTPHSEATHHISTELSSSASFGASLVSLCHFVHPSWLEELVRVCNDPDSKHYAPPSPSEHRPGFAESISLKYTSFDVWAPNPARSTMFSDLRFLCVCEKNRNVDSSLRELITRAEGTVETFNASDGRLKWRQALKRGGAKAGKTLVLVGGQPGLTAATGESGWNDLYEEACLYGKRFFQVQDLVHAVLDVDTSSFKERFVEGESLNPEEDHPSSSPLPSFVPNSLAEEMTMPSDTEGPPPDAAPRRRPPRRAVSRQPSEKPASPPANMEVDEDAPRPRRKALTRRVNADGKRILTGLGDTSAAIEAAAESADAPPPTAPPPVPMLYDFDAPTIPRSTKLKRRAPTDTSQSQYGTSAPADEPSYKKHKALFEAIDDPDQVGKSLSQLAEQSPNDFTDSTRSQSGKASAPKQSSVVGTLNTVPEESQESQAASSDSTTTKSRKRKAVPNEDEAAVSSEGIRSRAGSVAPASKKQAIEHVNAVEHTSHKPTSSTLKKGRSTGAPVGKPDTDPVFLKAVASTKRGKKAEDNFDREFNKLKISKPELDRGQTEPEDQWKTLDDFGDSSNIRGNFMVILELEVYKDTHRRESAAPNPEWDGRPNFKKFRRKNLAPRPKPVELVLSENSEAYSLGAGYDQSQPAQLDMDISQDSTQEARPSRSQHAHVIDDSEEDERPATRRKPAARAGTTKKAPKSTQKSQPLFVDDDDEDEDEDGARDPSNIDDDDSTVETLPSTLPDKRTKKPAPKGKRAPIIILDDDSDDDAFKGFKGRKRR